MPWRERSFEIDPGFRLPELGPILLRSYKKVATLVWLATPTPSQTTPAVVHTRRHALTDAELTQVRISAPGLRLRLVRLAGAAAIVSTVEGQLTAAGARPVESGDLLRRLIAPAQAQPAEAEPVVRAIRSGVQRILTHDPLVRVGERLPNGDTPVHQMRVGCRRLRSDLSTFAARLPRAWAKSLRAELRWLAGLLGAARDIEVLRERLARTAASDPLSPLGATAIERIDTVLAARQRVALEHLARAMGGKRYRDLVLQLADAALNPPLVAGKAESATPVAPAELHPPGALAPDDDWHEWRIEVKRARYAAEATSGKKDPRARELAHLQDLLGEHQDAAVAADTWLSFAGEKALTVTAARLFERERAAITAVRAEVLEVLSNR